MSYRPGTLRLTLPIGKTLGLAILLSILLIISGEVILRILIHFSILPEPYIGSYNPELDIKVQLLDTMQKKSGGIDCIFLGSSQFDDAVDPTAYQDEYFALTEQKITCFNFSLQTMTASPAGSMAYLLIQRYHPKLIIFGASARDFSRNFGEWTRPLLKDPWVVNQTGTANLKGFLTEKFYLYRILKLLRKDMNPDYGKSMQVLKNALTETGYYPKIGNDLSNPKENFIPQFVIYDKDLFGLEQMGKVNNSNIGTQIIMVEVPVHSSFIPFYIQADAKEYQALFIKPILKYASIYGVPFWETQKTMEGLISDQGWNDVKHLNNKGANIFSRWLARRTVDAVVLRQIQDPTR